MAKKKGANGYVEKKVKKILKKRYSKKIRNYRVFIFILSMILMFAMIFIFILLAQKLKTATPKSNCYFEVGLGCGKSLITKDSIALNIANFLGDDIYIKSITIGQCVAKSDDYDLFYIPTGNQIEVVIDCDTSEFFRDSIIIEYQKKGEVRITKIHKGELRFPINYRRIEYVYDSVANMFS